MTVQANAARLRARGDRTPHVGPAPVADLRCQNRRRPRSSSAEKVALKPRNWLQQITVWQRVLQQLLRVRAPSHACRRPDVLAVPRPGVSGQRLATGASRPAWPGHYREVLDAVNFRTDSYGRTGDDGEQRSGASAGRR